MADDKIDIQIDYPIDAAAKKRVQDALKEAIKKELSASGKPTPAVFGDGSVKG